MKKIAELFKGLFKSRLRAAVTLIIIAVLGIVIYRAVRGSQQQPQVQTQTVQRGSIVSSISASGQILTANVVSVTTDTSGLVKKVYVKDGDKVTAGQKIMEVTLDSDGQQRAASAYSSYLSAKNSLSSASTNLYTLDSTMWAANQKFINDAVARNLSVTDPTYIQENDSWQAAQANYLNQKNVVSQVQAALNNAWLSYQTASPTITAPVSGVITNLTYLPGMTISSSTSSTTSTSGQQIAVVQSEGTPMASFNVSEIDVPNVKVGQKATIQLDSIPDKTFTGKVQSVDRIGTVSSGVTNYPVVIQFDTAASEVLPNMSATANIIVATKDNVLLVPSSAIQVQNGQSVARVLKNGQTQTVDVEVGLTSDTQMEIVSGLFEGDEVVTSTVVTGSSSSSGGSVFGRTGFGGGGNRAIFGR